MEKKIFITGVAGFVGFSLSKFLLNKNLTILGLDGLTNYYDVELKKNRLRILKNYENFKFINCMLQDEKKLNEIVKKFCPEIIIHLAAQAGVRYSLENPLSYIDSNVLGSFNILQLSKDLNVNHLLIASSSSVYGGNTKLPFSENDKADKPLSIYAATKKSVENLAYSYSYTFKIPTTMMRFFTVYGPWGRPDMALFKFVKSIINNEEIEVYNNGQMSRDFTYIDDLVKVIENLMEIIPSKENLKFGEAPYRNINIGNSNKIDLMSFINAIEASLNKKAKIKFLPIQTGDVKDTWSNNANLKKYINFVPNTDYKLGIRRFVKWYKSYYFH